MKSLFLIFIILAIVADAIGQDQNPLALTEDARYFDFWEGKWIGLHDNNTLDSTVSFEVVRSVNPASFEEKWQLGNSRSAAIRAWDKSNSKWGFVWISDNGLFQIWDTRKVDGHWYIYKQFNVNGDVYLSRQGFLLQPDGTVVRVSEKSYDEKKWEVRFSQRLKKVALPK